MSDDVDCITCGGCFAEAWGFSTTEVREAGWVVKHSKSGPFYLCAECSRRFAERRRLNALLELEPARS